MPKVWHKNRNGQIKKERATHGIARTFPLCVARRLAYPPLQALITAGHGREKQRVDHTIGNATRSGSTCNHRICDPHPYPLKRALIPI